MKKWLTRPSQQQTPNNEFTRSGFSGAIMLSFQASFCKLKKKDNLFYMQNLEMNNVNGPLIQFLQIIIVFNTQLESNYKVSLWLLSSVYRSTMVRIRGDLL